MSTTLASGTNTTVTLPAGQVLYTGKTGNGVAVVGPGPQAGQTFTLGTGARIGPYGNDVTVFLTSNAGDITYQAGMPSSSSAGSAVRYDPLGPVASGDGAVAVVAAAAPSLDFTRAVGRFRKKLTIPLNISANGAGDSYGAGAGATGNNGFMQMLIAAYPQLNWSNYAFAGRPISSYRFAPLLAGVNRGATMGLVQSAANDIYVAIFGLNDLRGVTENGVSGFGAGSAPLAKQTLMSRLQAYVTWCLIPESQRVRMKTTTNSGVNPAVTLVTNAGSWGTGTLGSNANIINSNGVTNTASLTTKIGDVLVVRYMSNSSSTGTFTITVDGTDYGPFLNKAAYGSWILDSIILKLPNVAAHAVTITHASGDNLVLDSVDCVDSSTDFGGVYLYSGPAPLSPTGWAVAPTMNSARANSQAVATGASVSGTTLSIAGVTSGQFGVGQQVVAQTANPGVLAAGTVITEVLTQTASGVGGVGDFRISPAASVNGGFTSLTMSNPSAPLSYDNPGRDRFASWVDEAMAQLFNLGFNTVRVDAMAGYNPTSFEATGNEVHPNDLGHRYLFQKFRPYVSALIGA